ncbi:hypothetical protein P7K49_014938 [Saguinus oedipus]|uniref:Uncharacterized protein n=1 Tax=Saguinus oedipus TaxID=9490 RepID=A0ABQ9V7T8_SAGOE|nr:hypothetical protein P7K49_014938 [Saguinus oedipus]
MSASQKNGFEYNNHICEQKRSAGLRTSWQIAPIHQVADLKQIDCSVLMAAAEQNGLCFAYLFPPFHLLSSLVTLSSENPERDPSRLRKDRVWRMSAALCGCKSQQHQESRGPTVAPTLRKRDTRQSLPRVIDRAAPVRTRFENQDKLWPYNKSREAREGISIKERSSKRKGTERAPALSSSTLPQTLTAQAGAQWNRAYRFTTALCSVIAEHKKENFRRNELITKLKIQSIE